MILPNATADGLAFNASVDASPVPERVNIVGDPGALLAKLMLPLAVPVAVGANSTEKLLLWFAARVTGSDNPDMLNAAPEIFAAVMEREVLPLFIKVTVSVAFPPTDTSPKLSEAGDTDKLGAVPVPDSATETVPSVALLVTCNVALRLPLCCGVNWT